MEQLLIQTEKTTASSKSEDPQNINLCVYLTHTLHSPKSHFIVRLQKSNLFPQTHDLIYGPYQNSSHSDYKKHELKLIPPKQIFTNK